MSVAGVPFDSDRRLRATRALLLRTSAVLESLAVWWHNKPKTKRTELNWIAGLWTRWLCEARLPYWIDSSNPVHNHFLENLCWTCSQLITCCSRTPPVCTPDAIGAVAKPMGLLPQQTHGFVEGKKKSLKVKRGPRHFDVEGTPFPPPPPTGYSTRLLGESCWQNKKQVN